MMPPLSSATSWYAYYFLAQLASSLSTPDILLEPAMFSSVRDFSVYLKLACLGFVKI
jgi:hypothetical protein